MKKDMKKDGGSAFPCAETQYSESIPGMTLRDYFAGQAMAGEITTWTDTELKDYARKVARRCYAISDAMIEERSK